MVKLFNKFHEQTTLWVVITDWIAAFVKAITINNFELILTDERFWNKEYR
jgi:hypothetical protein